ncbi:TIR domain-containing protein [Sulfurovum sp. NBC37-1]|uniref:TIR domain-containing protein n=1 Tax=Sulfurovum sp. (strain NBC37-1) TaxID=387093 RepID=UPI0001587B3E|nr:TIR domain-containing protein [Sulfurovum sp. NBC37-1]BAF73050.1 hypothetical protein SUN_2110 [Sulfurovum sp. NBC37-1]
MSKSYKAFIGYSHDDEAFGSWLHKELEKYKIPRKLREDYQTLPKSLYPIFRDRYELNAGDDLGVEILKALENSDALIVVCSTKSADSKWVNKEIVDFKMMHGEDRVFPIIVDGEPFAIESDKFDDVLECFPEALKYKLDSEGNLTDERTSILASSTIEKEDGRELAKLKLIAGILGVPFGEFYRRDEEQKRRDRIKLISIWSLFTLVIVGFSVFIWNQKIKIDKNKQVIKKELYNNLYQQGIDNKNNLNNPVYAKFLFANAITKSSDKNEKKEIKILYKTVNGGIKLKKIFNNYISHRGWGHAEFTKSQNKILFLNIYDDQIKIFDKNTSNPILMGLSSDNAIVDKKETMIFSWSAYPNNNVKLWKMNGKIIYKSKFKNEIMDAYFDKKKVMVLTASNWLRLRSIPDNKILQVFKFDNNLEKAIFIRDKKQILTISGYANKKVVKILDINDSNKPFLVFNHAEEVSLSKDNNIIAIYGENKIKIWDIKTRKMLKELSPIKKSPYRMTFNKQNTKLLLNYFEENYMKAFIFDDEDIFCPNSEIIMSHDGRIAGSLFNKKGNFILSWSDDKTIKLWDNCNPRQSEFDIDNLEHKPTKIIKCSYKVKNAVFSNDETKILSWGENRLDLWSITDNKPIFTIMSDSEISSAEFNKDETELLTSTENGKIQLWDTNLSKYNIKYSNGSKKIILSKNQSKILSYNNETLKEKLKIVCKDNFYHIDGGKAKFYDRATKILSWNQYTIKVFDTKTCKNIYTLKDFNRVKSELNKIKNPLIAFGLKLNSYIKDVILSQDKKTIFTIGGETIKLWNINDKKLLKTYTVNTLIGKSGTSFTNGTGDTIEGATFNANKTKMASWYKDGGIRVWDLNDTQPRVVLKAGYTNGVQFIEDNKILSWGISGIKFWNIKNDKPILLVDINATIDDEIVLSKDSKRIVYYERENLYLYNIYNNKLETIIKHNKNLNGTFFNKNEKNVLSWCRDELNIWDIDTKKLLFNGKHSHNILHAIFSKDEKEILSWDEKEIRLWSVKTGKVLVTIKHNKKINGACFSKNETKILSWGNDEVKEYSLLGKNNIESIYYPLKVEVEIGACLYKKIHNLTKKEWLQKKKKYEQILKESSP